MWINIITDFYAINEQYLKTRAIYLSCCYISGIYTFVCYWVKEQGKYDTVIHILSLQSKLCHGILCTYFLLNCWYETISSCVVMHLDEIIRIIKLKNTLQLVKQDYYSTISNAVAANSLLNIVSKRLHLGIQLDQPGDLYKCYKMAVG